MRTKMTREEALKKVNAVVSKSHPEKVNDIVQALEALGLIKFDEPEKSLTDAICGARYNTMGSSIDQSSFIKYLNAHGYEIVKKS
jgi:hypothetical protein